MGNFFYKGGTGQVVLAVVALGAGAVTTQTRAAIVVPQKCRITGIKYRGTAAPTATSLTAAAHARTLAGAAGNELQSAATDIDFASAAAAKTGVEASLTATPADLKLEAGQLIEIVVTADTVNPGPGDLVVEITLDPRI